MSCKQFFVERYRKLGWEFKPVQVRQAIRINQSNAKGKNILPRLREAGVGVDKVPFLSSGYWIKKTQVSPGATAEYLLGLYSMQEAAAQIPVSLFSALNGKTVLDACAAPGGKTVQLADAMNNVGAVVALDINKNRLSPLANHLERCHVRCVVVYHLDARRVTGLNLKFDRILLDVPCSGNFASDPEWFNQRTITDIERNAKVQREILTEAAKCLSEDGEIVYSTCSLEPEEDEFNIDWAVRNLQLQTQPIDCPGENGLTNALGKKLHPLVARSKRIWPEQTQGFFVCKLKRKEMVS